MKGFVLGFRCGLRGIATCATTPRLWPWAIAPIAVGMLLFGLPMFCAWSWLTETVSGLVTKWAGEGWAGWAGGVTGVLGAIVALGIAYFVLGPFVRVVAAPFLALLSDRWVRELAGRDLPPPPGGPAVRFVVVPLRDAIVFLGLRLVVTGMLLWLLCIPFGAIVFAALLTPLEGMDRMDVAQSSRAIGLGSRLRFCFRNFGACAGLGTVVTLLLLLPGVNLLLLPGLAVGAVLLDQALSADFPRPIRVSTEGGHGGPPLRSETNG